MNQLTRVCRICLVGGDTLQLHSIENTQLQDTFEMLSKTQLIRRDLPKSVCYICSSQLRKCHQFMQFIQESDAMLKLMLLYGTTADAVAKTVGNRSPFQLRKLDPVYLSIPGFVNSPAPEITTKAVEAEDIAKEFTESQKETKYASKKEIKSTRDEQVLMNEDLRDENQSDKEELETNMDNIEETTQNLEDDKENKVYDCEKEIASKRIAMLKEKIEEIDKEKEQKAKKKEKKVIEKEQVSIKKELIAQGNALEEELSGASVKEEIKEEIEEEITEEIKEEIQEEIQEEIKIEINEEEYGISEFCNKVSTDAPIPNEGFVNVSSRALMNELKNVLRQNLGLLPEIKEMEVESAQTVPSDNTHKCIVCARAFVDEASLDLHLHEHKEETPYSCRHCRRAFAKKAHLDNHMWMMHMSLKDNACKICDRSFRPPSDLNTVGGGTLAAHMRYHTSERHLCCRLCKKRYKSIRALKKHNEIHKRDEVLPKG